MRSWYTRAPHVPRDHTFVFAAHATQNPTEIHYSVAKTHRMPKVAGHVSPKGPFGAKEQLIIGLFLPQRGL